MATIARAYVQIVPSMKGVGKSIITAFNAQGRTAGESAGRQATSGMRHGMAGMSAVFGAVSAVASKAMDAIGSSIGSAVDRADTMSNFPKIMRNFGYSSDDAAKAVKRMSDRIDGLPTSLPALTGMVQQLVPVTGNLKDATDVSLAFNDALLAGGQSTQVQTNALVQYSQMLAAGKPDMQAWRSIEDAMPGQLNQVAKAMLGATANSQSLYEAVKDGRISFSDLNREMVRLDTQGVGGYASFARQARDATQGIGTAVKNVRNRISKAIQSVIDAIGDSRIASAINALSEGILRLGKTAAGATRGIVATIGTLSTRIRTLADQTALRQLSSSLQGVGRSVRQAMGEAAGAVKDLLFRLTGIDGSARGAATGAGLLATATRIAAQGAQALSTAIRHAGDWIKDFIGSIDEHAILNFAQGVLQLGKGLAQVAASAIKAVAGLLGLGSGEKSASGAAGALNTVLGSMASALKGVAHWIQENHIWLGRMIRTLILMKAQRAAFDAIGRGAQALSSRLSNTITAVGNLRGAFATLKGGETAAGLTSVMGAVQGLGSALKGGAVKAASTAKDSLAELGRHAASAGELVKGAGGASESLAGHLGKTAEAAGQAVQGAASIAKGMGKAGKAVQGLSTAASLIPGIGTVVSAAGTVVGGVMDAVSAAEQKQAEDTASYVGKVKTEFSGLSHMSLSGLTKADDNTGSDLGVRLGSLGQIKSLSDELKTAGVSDANYYKDVVTGNFKDIEAKGKAASKAQEKQMLEAAKAGSTAWVTSGSSISGVYQDITAQGRKAAEAVRKDIDSTAKALSSGAEASKFASDTSSLFSQLGTTIRANGDDWKNLGADWRTAGNVSKETKSYLSGLASSAKLTAEQMLKSGSNTQQVKNQMQEYRDSLVSTAEQSGMSAQAAEQLADSLGLIPSQVGTKISVDSEMARSDVAKYLDRIGATPKQKTTLLKALTKAAGGDISRLRLKYKDMPRVIATLSKVMGTKLSVGQLQGVINAARSVPKSWTTRMGVTDKASRKLHSIQLSVKNTKGKNITISGKNTKALKALADVAGVKLKGKKTSVTLTKKQFDAAMNVAKGDLSRLKGKSIRIDAKGNVSAVAKKAKNAANSVPKSHTTSFTAKNGVTKVANAARASANSVPSRHNTTLAAKDSASKAARSVSAAIRAIQKSHTTAIGQHGAGPSKAAVDRLISSIDALPSSKTVTVTYEERHKGGHFMGGLIHRATGGFAGQVLGAGNSTSDSIPAMLSNGEYVIRAASAQRLGLDALDQMNRTGVAPATLVERDDGMGLRLLEQVEGLREDIRRWGGMEVVMDGRELGRAMARDRIGG